MNPENKNFNPVTLQPTEPPHEPASEIFPTGINTEQNSAPPTLEDTPPTIHKIPKPKNKLMVFAIVLLILTSIASLGYWAYKSYFVKNTVVPAESPTPMATADPTANWKTYTNSVHGILFKYPDSWKITEKKGGIENGKTYNTTVELSNDDALISMIFNVDGIGGKPQTYEGRPFVLDGHNLFQFNKLNTYNNTKQNGISDSLTTLGFFMIDNVTYSITLTHPISYNEADEKNILQEFDQILSTFKFLNTSSITSSWKSYTHPGALFEIKYPSTWRVAEFSTGVGFGPKEVAEDVLWGINIYSKSDNTKEKIVDEVGDQFSNRKQTQNTVDINGVKATKVITTTPTLVDWYSEIVIIEYEQGYIAISNGAITDNNLQKVPGVPAGITFKDFYSTFMLSGQNITTKEQAAAIVTSLPEVKDFLAKTPNGKVAFDSEDLQNNAWVIHVYEDLSDHTATFGWYLVGKSTGKVSKK